jgi:general stress protein YciG
MADSTSNRGFASMDDSKQEEIARKGGKASHSGGRSNASSASRGSTTSGRGSKEGQRKGGKNSHDNQYTV